MKKLFDKADTDPTDTLTLEEFKESNKKTKDTAEELAKKMKDS